MKRSLKAALLSGLVFPGVGYFVLRRTVRGVIAVVLAGICTVYLVSTAVTQANALMDKLMSGEIALDPAHIEGLAAASSAGLDAGTLNLATFVLMAAWIISVVDGYRIGHRLDEASPREAPGSR